MTRHRTEPSKTLIEGIGLLGEALGYASDPEYAVTGSGGAVDVAWLRNGDDREPLFVFEVETTASSSAANNPLKVFAQPTTELVKPLFFFHVFLSRSERSERVRLLEQEYGRQNYGIYRLGAGNATRLVIDVLRQHRRVAESVRILPLVDALEHQAWRDVDLDAVLETIETDGFSACYVPDYALRTHRETRFRAHLVRQLTNRLPYPSRREGECWYRTYVGQQWSTPLHLGVVARERPEAEAIMLGRLRGWQENSDEMRQIGPYFGLNRDYDHFLLGIAAPLWTLVAALFPGRDSKGYIAGELRLLVDELYRLREPLEAILPALWLLWLAAAADADDAYESARELVTSRGGVNNRFLAVPPSLVSFEEREDEWWREGQVEPVDPPPITAFRANYLAPTAAAVDPVRVALEALLDDRTIFEWGPRIIAALARPVVATD